MAPVVLNAFQVPLIDENHDFLSGSLVYFGEELLVLLVNEDLLELGEENLSGLRVPVHLVLVHALFGEGRRSHEANLLPV